MRTRVNSTDLHFALVGDSGATPVVFIHGSGRNLHDWSAQLGAFAARHRVLVYSRRYHPPNAPHHDGQVYSPTLHAEDLAALLQALNLGPVHLVGSGYGAYTALVLGLEYPHLVRTLVLAEPSIIPLLYRTPAGDSLRRRFLGAAVEPARAAFRRGDSVEAVRRFTDGLHGTPGAFDNLSAPARAVSLAHAFELRRELLADPDQYMPPVSCARLGRMATPVLLLRAQRSPRMFHIIIEELARCLNTETVIVVPNAGHAIHATNPAQYNQVVLQYLTTH